MSRYCFGSWSVSFCWAWPGVCWGDELTVLKVLLDWLKDVYQRYGYVAVLVCLVVICAIVFAVILFLPPDVQAMLYRLVGGN